MTPNNDAPKTRRKIKPEIILAILFVLFVVIAIGGMVAIDVLGDAKLEQLSAPKDAIND